MIASMIKPSYTDIVTAIKAKNIPALKEIAQVETETVKNCNVAIEAITKQCGDPKPPVTLEWVYAIAQRGVLRRTRDIAQERGIWALNMALELELDAQ